MQLDAGGVLLSDADVRHDASSYGPGLAARGQDADIVLAKAAGANPANRLVLTSPDRVVPGGRRAGIGNQAADDRAGTPGESSGAGKRNAGKLAARGHLELPEHLAKVIADG